VPEWQELAGDWLWMEGDAEKHQDTNIAGVGTGKKM
jgi:hypothetical protein